MRQIQTVVDIAADRATVWNVLTDFAAYPEWNPFVRRIEGEPKSGEWLKVTLQLPGMSAISFRSQVQPADVPSEFGWRGHLLIPSLFSGHHQFHLQARGEATRLHHFEQFSGILVPLMWWKIEAPSRIGFEAMNAALKARAEEIATSESVHGEAATA
jgi:hypothetical protein